jgi:hypothetical protein
MTKLRPVSFSKKAPSERRLSTPRIPGRHSDKFWTEAQKQILHDHYVYGGLSHCMARLAEIGAPARSPTAVYVMANILGLKCRARSPRRDWKEKYTGLDAAIAEAWPTMEMKRGAIKALADRLGVPRYVLLKRVRALGFSLLRHKEPEWSEIELALLAKTPLHDLHSAARIFRAHGFVRSETALKVQATKRGISTRFKGGFSAHAAARMLGVDIKWITARIFDGRIKARRRGTKRLVQQGGDVHVIEPAELRRYVVAHLGEIDFRRVEKFALVALLVQAP